jgi:predicted alpha/beta hydrolase family esterase
MTTFELSPALIVPGYQGSGEGHWQQWLHARWPGSALLTGVDWDRPVLAHWAERIRDEIARAHAPLWIVAHSFGCLASVVAAADRPQSVAGLLLVAPADPARFHLLGLGTHTDRRLEVHSLADVLPLVGLQVPGLVLASRDDPWMPLSEARRWASLWQLPLQDLGAAGHVNTASGFGPWPQLLQILARWHADLQPGTDQTIPGIQHRMSRGRGSALAHVRRHTRRQLELLNAAP